jgi:hypothetical protein
MTWILFIVCLAVSFVFSGTEAGLLSLNRLRLRQLSRSGDDRCELVEILIEQRCGRCGGRQRHQRHESRKQVLWVCHRTSLPEAVRRLRATQEPNYKSASGSARRNLT